DIPWPHLPSDGLDLTDDVFRQMARQFPQVAPMRELRHALSQLRLNDLAVGPDGNNRCLLSAFSAKTSRNAPSNSKFIFGPSAGESTSVLASIHGRYETFPFRATGPKCSGWPAAWPRSVGSMSVRRYTTRCW